jgi:ribosome-associated toxin RatA of RatAB toxin-antitoxin module
MEVRRTLLVPHPAERMFDLIEAAEHYPQFLPWCRDARILERDESVVAAALVLDLRGVRLELATRNPKRRPEWMAIRLVRGPFRRFEGEWQLTPLTAEGCRVEFSLRYDFDSTVVRRLAGPVFDRIADTLVDAFVARADRVYARPGPQTPPGAEDNPQRSEPE